MTTRPLHSSFSMSFQQPNALLEVRTKVYDIWAADSNCFFILDIPVWGFRLCIQTLAITHQKAFCQDLIRYNNKVESLLNVSNQ